MLQSIAVHCSALQPLCISSTLRFYCNTALSSVAVCVLQCVAVRCSLLQRVAVCCISSTPRLHPRCHLLQSIEQIEQCVAVCCSVLQCVAVCCSVLQSIEQIELKSAFEHRKLPANLLDYFLRSNKSNIHQCNVLQCVAVHRLRLQFTQC